MEMILAVLLITTALVIGLWALVYIAYRRRLDDVEFELDYLLMRISKTFQDLFGEPWNNGIADNFRYNDRAIAAVLQRADSDRLKCVLEHYDESYLQQTLRGGIKAYKSLALITSRRQVGPSLPVIMDGLNDARDAFELLRRITNQLSESEPKKSSTCPKN